MNKKTVETQLKNDIKKLFKLLNIKWYSNPAGLGTKRGRPDLEAIHKGITYFIECKHPKQGKMSDYQNTERRDIERSGAPYIHAKSVEDVIREMKLPFLFKD